MYRLNIFVKANVDVHDSLIYSRVNGEIQWNGLNTLLTERHPGCIARIRHEPCARWDLIGIEHSEIPKQLVERNLDLGSLKLETQFCSKLLVHPADVVVLSIQPDITNTLLRHRRDDYLFLPANDADKGLEDRCWMAENFTAVELLTPHSSMQRLASLVGTIRARSNPSILVFNMSSAMPGDRIVSYRGLEDALSTRIRAFNVALVEAATELDFSIVDVDQIVACAGAERLKLDWLHYVPEGYRLIADEVLRLLEDLGHFDRE
jgi:hypothetical protein